jgi:predicted NAD/FAD-dependent oxidoreductase
MADSIHIAIIGGGIAGTSFLHELVSINHSHGNIEKVNIRIDLYDQGRGLGGRSSHRYVKQDDKEYRFDHGCQFFRGDTLIMQNIISKFLEKKVITQWKGNFEAHSSTTNNNSKCDFFGMPFNGPFYVSTGGMHNLPLSLVNAAKKMEGNKTTVNLFPATRVSKLHHKIGKWYLEGIGGNAAFHDTKESIAAAAKHNYLNNNDDGYDIVVLTDISSTSFDSWHRASAGVPDLFSKQIRNKVGARVPLFTAMVAFEEPLPDINFDTITFPLNNGNDCWFAAKTNSKPGFENLVAECWTIVSTPSYAAREIKKVPMQDAKTGEFLPQERGYLQNVPAKELLASFLKAVNISESNTPNIVHINAQRWGSAMPAPRHLATDDSSPTRCYLSGVAYDTGKCELAPTKAEGSNANSFHYDETLHLMQIGDMISNQTPGMEAAVISAVEGAKFVMEILKKKN